MWERWTSINFIIYEQNRETHKINLKSNLFFFPCHYCPKFNSIRLINPLKAELNPMCHLLPLLGVHHFLHVSRIRVKSLTLRLLMSYIYIYIEHLFLMFLDHTRRCTTVGRTPLDEWSARRRDLYLTTHDTHNRQISMPPVGFEPRSQQASGRRPTP